MGGDHGHDHHEVKVPKIPDWRKYKVEDIPQLVTVQRILAQRGLKDPWLRNEVWRFDEKEHGPFNTRFRNVFFRGFKWGLAAAIISTIYTKMTEDHGHGHEGGHGSSHH